MGWVGVDFDGTLVTWGHGHNHNVLQVGEPIPGMIALVKCLRAAGQEVRIFTARVGPATDDECRAAFEGRGVHPPYTGELGPNVQLDWENYQRTLIETWCGQYLGEILPITCVKDFHMWYLLDDRALQVHTNTGVLVDHAPEDLLDVIQRGLDAMEQQEAEA